MSTTGNLVRAVVTAAAMEEQIRTIDYASYVKTTVLMYEILINLGREVDLVWSTKFRWSNVIYYMSRYPVVVFQIWSLCYKASTPQYVLECPSSQCFFWYASFLPTRAGITASFALRVYAIMDGELFFVIILSALGIAIVGLDVWQGVQSSCTQSSDKLSTISTFIFLACFDVLATILVTVKMFKTIRWNAGVEGLGNLNIAVYILRSGVLYFSVVTIPQLIAIALYFDPQQGSSTILNNVMLVLSSIMVSRFLLDLREINRNTIVGDTAIPTTMAHHTVVFAPNTTLDTSSTPSRVVRRRHGRFDDSSLFRDFTSDNEDALDYVDNEFVEEILHSDYHPNANSELTEFNRTRFGGKELTGMGGNTTSLSEGPVDGFMNKQKPEQTLTELEPVEEKARVVKDVLIPSC
ncbi:hypothetical protein J3R30DRAFT_3403094 [Lentinula aciculospora]|uniref:DUF6533 domain-containing protein n=1 Tax=Lentinula aciculospora TaxID=153920 RepID=A0A9W9AIT2_9AGAR|nr:hypothetical protein J3R30DRAFT_3403094 [Lentinula aciculospora]